MMEGYIITNDDLASRPTGPGFWCKNGDGIVSWYQNPFCYINKQPSNERTMELWTIFVEEELEDTSLHILDVPDVLVEYFCNAPIAEPDYNYLFGG